MERYVREIFSFPFLSITPLPGTGKACSYRRGPTLLWAVARYPFLTFNILQFYNFYFRISSFTSHVKRHVGVLKWPMVSFMVSLVGWKAPSPRAVAVHSRVDSNSHWSWGSHSSDGLAICWSCGACGTERRASHVVRTCPVAQAIPIAGSWMPFSRNFKSVPARAIRRWPQTFPGFPFGLSALTRRLLRAGLWIQLRSGSWLIPCLWLNHLKERCMVMPLTKWGRKILCSLIFYAENNYNNSVLALPSQR